MNATLGTVTTKRHMVVWRMEPGEARDLADFIEETTTGEDMARRDASALRKAAFDADGEEDPDA